MTATREADFSEEKVKALFGDTPSIKVAYLFGSQVEGPVGLQSDYDFAVLTTGVTYESPEYALLFSALSNLLKAVRLDVALLEHAPIELAYAVIAQGRLLYERDPATRVEFEARILGLYGDYLPFLRRQRSEILEGDQHEARIQRYRAAFGRARRTLGAIGTLRSKSRTEFDEDPYLRDIAARNLEIGAQCCIDISTRQTSC